MTGLRPDSLRVWDLETDFRATVPDVVTLPQHFMRHGYRTVQIGKIYHNTIPDSRSWHEEIHLHGFPYRSRRRLPRTREPGHSGGAQGEDHRGGPAGSRRRPVRHVVLEGQRDREPRPAGQRVLRRRADRPGAEGARRDSRAGSRSSSPSATTGLTCRSTPLAGTGTSTTPTRSRWRRTPTRRRTRRPSPAAIWPSCAGMPTSRRRRSRGRAD